MTNQQIPANTFILDIAFQAILKRNSIQAMRTVVSDKEIRDKRLHELNEPN